MIYAEIRKDGTLFLRASEPVEMYALSQWEKGKKKGGSSKLLIEYGEPMDIIVLAKAIGKDMVDWRRWQQLNQDGATFSPEDASIIKGEPK